MCLNNRLITCRVRYTQVGKNKAVHADGFGQREGAVVRLFDGRAVVDRSVRERFAKSSGHARLSGGAVFRDVYARNQANNEGDA